MVTHWQRAPPERARPRGVPANSCLALCLLKAVAMNVLRLLLASSTLALLPACTSPIDSPPAKDPDPINPPGITATLKVTPGWTFGVLTAASAGAEGAVAYTEVGDVGGVERTVIKLQRLDGTGAARGRAVELGFVPTAYLANLTLATDGSRYLACWEHESEIACAFSLVSEGPAFPALSVVGGSPSVAYGAGTWALAYGVPGHLAIVRLANDGSAAGNPVMFDAEVGMQPMARLAATKLGFVLVGGREDVRAHLLDSSFAPITDPVSLGARFWTRSAVAVSGRTAAVSVSKPYGSDLFLVDAESGAFIKAHEFSGGYKEGLNVALAADEASFGILSADDANGLHYDTTKAGDVVVAEGVLEADRGRYDSGALALVRVNGVMLLVASQGRGVAELIIAPVPRP